ncbi:MAG TPA: hypothetical protein VGJ37_08290 [Pyrinomonadaceae bacterium]|jgi:hypothetical protein
MSEPEIARRCPFCGVSLRQRALYCPQCGQQISDNEIGENPAPSPSGLIGVADNVRDRVEKIKHVSSVMIDQAAYDPSLRFLLVAGVVFVLFLILLILNKVIG